MEPTTVSTLPVILPVIGSIIVALIGIIPFLKGQRATKRANELEEQLKEGAKLIYHPLFKRLKSHKRVIENRLEADYGMVNKGKALIFKHLMLRKYSIFEKNLYELAKDIDDCIANCKGDCALIEEKNFKCLTKSLKQFNDIPYESDNDDLSRQALLATIPKFNIWHGDRVRLVEEMITMLCNDDAMYEDCHSKQVAVFDIYLMAFALTLTDSLVSAKLINGDLKGYIFRGVEIQ